MRRVVARGATRVAATYVGLGRATCARMDAAIASTAIVAAPSSAMRWGSMFETPGRRDQEAFLYQYDPLQVLGLPQTTDSAAVVTKAYEAAKAEAGPTGKSPNKTRMERVQKAYDIIMDPQSVFYSKAGVSDQSRKALMLDVMPRASGALLRFQAGVGTILLTIGCFAFFYTILFPVIKMGRAASRSAR